QEPDQSAGDAVVVALESVDRSNEESMVRVAVKVLDLDFGLKDSLRDVQLEIVRKTAPFGPVLILAPDEETRGSIFRECAAFDLCTALGSGNVRIEVADYDTPWIRDYGPIIQAAPDGPVSVVDTAYYDVREDVRLTSQATKVAFARYELLNQMLTG